MKYYLLPLSMTLLFSLDSGASFSCARLISRVAVIGAKVSDFKFNPDQWALMNRIYNAGYLAPSQVAAGDASEVSELVNKGFVREKFINYSEYIVGSRYQLTLKGFRQMFAREQARRKSSDL